MKANKIGTRREGTILMVTVCTLAVLTTAAVSYLFMLKDDNYFVARDQAWNRALVVAEAGIEEAFAHINRGGISQSPQSFGPADGWTVGTNGFYYLPAVRTNLYGGSYNVSLSSTNSAYVTITSVGTVIAPLTSANVSRTIQVTAQFKSSFDQAMAALKGVNLNGNTITVDSYDSRDTNLFPGGVYNVTNRQAHGDVSTPSTATNALQLGNANIMGKVHVGPGGTMSDVKLGPNGSVGDVPFVTGGGTGFENSTYFADDFNKIYTDVNVPYTNGASITPPSSGKGNSTNILSLTSGMYYYNGAFSIPNNAELQVGAYQTVELYVTGNFSMNSGANIDIQTGGQLVVFVGTPSGTATSASFSTVNTAGNAFSFQFYGLPSTTQVTWNGNDSYVGTVYAPEATYTLGGGGKNTMDYQGACVVNSVTMNGKFNFHYDSNLGTGAVWGDFVPTSWQELTSR